VANAVIGGYEAPSKKWRSGLARELWDQGSHRQGDGARIERERERERIRIRLAVDSKRYVCQR